jgi:Na+/proline symporter
MPWSNKALLRWLPFAMVALLSIAMAAWAPLGRKPFYLDANLSAAALAFSIQKPPHIVACAVLALLAVAAAGRRRLLLAFALAVLVGACWELAQTTVVGHAARLADLAPDALGAILGCLIGSIFTSTLQRSASERKLHADAGRPRRARRP